MDDVGPWQAIGPEARWRQDIAKKVAAEQAQSNNLQLKNTSIHPEEQNERQTAPAPAPAPAPASAPASAPTP